MLSIFSPRVDIVATKNGEVKYKPHVSPSIGNFDKYYLDYTIKFVPKPLCDDPNCDDYCLELKVIESQRDIAEVINSQAGDVGLEAMLEKYRKTGDPSVLPGSVKAGEGILDLTQIPSDGAEYFEYIHGLAKKYEELPVELRKDMSLSDFVKNVTDKQVNDWLDSIKPVEEKKDGE